MKTKLYILFTLIIFCVFFQIEVYAFDGGSGTIDDPYQISTAGHLDDVRNDLDAYYVQTADIDLSGYGDWTSIGSSTTPFRGNYDGQDYIIDNLTIDNNTKSQLGLFGYVDSNGLLKRIHLDHTMINGNDCIGSLVGQNDGIILNCSSINCTINGDVHVGGLVGRNEGILVLSFSTGTIVANQNTGGLVGLSSYSNEGIIERCYSSANVTSNYEDGGGLVGDNAGIIKNCYASGNVDGNISGGLAGNNSTKSTGSKGKIINSYSTGFITGTTKGGLIARLEGSGATTQNSFWDKDTSGLIASLQGTGKITEEMQNNDTFTNIATDGLTDAWDLAGIWAMDGSYPYLRESPLADVTISFMSNGGTTISEQSMGYYSKITKPSDPIKTGYTFAGWYIEETLTNPWNFDCDRANENKTLYAKWAENYPLSYVDMNNWIPKLEYDGTNGKWEVLPGGRTVEQLRNGGATLFLSPNDVINTVIKGTIKVDTNSDDDYIGFVLGYQDVVDSNYEFLLFDWKQGDQTNEIGTAYAGFSLAKVKGNLSIDDLSGSSNYFWYHREDEKFEILRTKWLTTNGWKDYKTNTFEILYTYNRVKVKVNDQVIFDVEGTFKPGKMGFYNCSQGHVIYGNVKTAVGSSSDVAPIAQADAYGVIKNTSRTINCSELMENDYDPDLDNIKIKVVSSVSHGMLPYDPDAYYLGSDVFTYTPAIDYLGSDSFAYKLIDSDGMESEVFTVRLNVIEGDNVAPTDIDITNTTVIYQSPNDTEVGVLSTIDANDGDIHDYMLINNSEGRFKIFGNTIKIGDTSKLLQGGNYNILVRTTDFRGAFFEKTFTITVPHVPTILRNKGMRLNKGAEETISSTTMLSATDLDTEDGTLLYTITSGVTNGRLENSDNPESPINCFTQQDLDDGKIKYINDGSNTITDSFSFKVSDDTIYELTGQIFNITIISRQSYTPSTSNHETQSIVLVNGKVVEAGTTKTTKENGLTTTRIIIDEEIIRKKLEKEDKEAIVTIPISTKSEIIIGRLNGQIVKDMEKKETVLEVKTGEVAYILPAAQINIDAVSEKIGKQIELKDIWVDVMIATPTDDTVKIIQDTADENSYKIVIKPVEFEITCINKDKVVNVSKFNSYVERIIAIPDDIENPQKITTGIVFNNDGTFSHVPTTIYIDEETGKYYAKINSLTNSIYSFIYNPKEFDDMDGHWAKEDVNDLGSRLVVNGVDKDIFAADNEMTRAEFTAILVRALGLLRPDLGKNIFSDVNKTQWYYDGVSIAYEYGIVKGIGNAIFKPNNSISRQEAMVMISRAIELTKNIEVSQIHQNSDDIFKDFLDSSELSSWAIDAAALCVDNEIIKGCNGKLYAKENITRAEAVAIVRRMLKKTKLIN